MFCLGLMYYKGWGTAVDKATAAAWYERAAETGISGAMVNLAILYNTGEGVSQDVLAAYAWLLLAKTWGAANTEAALQALASKLDANEIKKAQKKAATWDSKHRYEIMSQHLQPRLHK
jgi:TPR repeat protein